MAKLIYFAIASLDGYIADEHGDFDWAAPDEEVHAFVNDLTQSLGTHLYGRRMYETMRFWDSAALLTDDSPAMRDFARIWQAADKIVYSRTLESVATARTRLESSFDPEAIRELKTTATRDLSVGGPDLASHAIKAGLVDEFQLFATPILVGGGNPVFPNQVRGKLDLLDERRFRDGTVYLQYRVRS